MYPILFSVGQFKLYSFGSFIALGALVAGLVLYRLTRSRKLPTQHLFDVVLYSLLGGLIGARVGYYILYAEQFQSFWQIFYFWQGGLVALTGIITGFLVFLYHIRQEKAPAWIMLDVGLIAFLIGWAIGKFGCHLSACTVGRAGTFLTINGTYPVDLLSLIWAVLLVAVLWRLWHQQKLQDGAILFLAIEGLFLGEFLLKTLKADFGEGLSRLEAAAYLLLIIGTYFAFWRLHGPKINRQQLGSMMQKLVSRRRA